MSRLFYSADAGVKCRQPSVNHGSALLDTDRVQRLLQHRINILCTCQFQRQRTTCGCGDAAMIGWWIKGDINIIGARGKTVRMHRQCREFWRAPAAIVVNDLQEWQLVLPRHPVHDRGLRENIRAITC